MEKKDEIIISIANTEIKNSEDEKLPGIKLDAKLNFSEHVNDIISNSYRKVNALSRVVSYMSLCKKKTQVNLFFNSQFSYSLFT